MERLRVSYVCRSGATQRDAAGDGCFSFRATHVEARLAELVFEVVGPAGAAAAKQAAERLVAVHAQERRLIVDRLDARREVEARAAREYKKTDATYTTVRQRLAQEWEEALLAVQREQEQLACFDHQQQRMPTIAQQQELDHLGQNIRRIWHHPKASMILKKQIVRTLIEEIVVDLEKPRNEIVLVIHWAGGHHTPLRAPTRWRRRRGNTNDVKSVIRTLRKIMADESIASVLNRERLSGDDRATWTSHRVAEYRQQHNIPAFCEDLKEGEGWMTQAEAATRLQISPMSMSRLVQIGIVPAEQPRPGLPTVITGEDLHRDHVKRAVLLLKSSNNRPLPLDPNQQNLFPFEITAF